MDKQLLLQSIAQQLERPAQSLQGLSAQPQPVLEQLQASIQATLEAEQLLLESSYRKALPNWLYALVMPLLRRNARQ